MGKNHTGRNHTAGILAALLIFIAADIFLFMIAAAPRMENAAAQKEWKGLDILSKYRDNPDMIGWLQVEGTNINYPVMGNDIYLYRDFNGDHDDSGSLFVEEDWSEDDICTLIYGHNMWMDGTMFHELHRFIDPGFFSGNRTIRFYAVEQNGVSAEKRTYEILYCIRTRVDEWNYASCRYICSGGELAAFVEECGKRASRSWETDEETPDGWGELIVLSTCSYHVRGKKGRLLLVGGLTDKIEQTRIDVNQR